MHQLFLPLSFIMLSTFCLGMIQSFRLSTTKTYATTAVAMVADSNLSAMAEKLRINRTDRHIFLCADQTKPKCCSLEEGLESWVNQNFADLIQRLSDTTFAQDFLKRRLKELDLVGGKADSLIIQRTKANCLQLCQKGPIAVVYPDGKW